MAHRTHALAALALAATLVPAAGCNDLFWALGKDRAGPGVAQLSVNNAGAIASLINSDATCGFSAPQVKDAAEIVGETGELGSITLRAECTWDFGAGTPISDGNCLGEGAQVATGLVHVVATRRMSGLLTGDAASPVIPEGPDAVTIDIAADFSNFSVESEGSGNMLTWVEGSVGFTVKPKLAVSTDEGAPGICAAPTGNTRLSNITFAGETQVVLLSPEAMLNLTVAAMEVTAYNGVYDDLENHIVGFVDVQGQKFELDQDLNPDYDHQEFQDGWACEPDGFGVDPDVRMVKLVDQGDGTVGPDYNCTADIPADRLADGIARLSVNNFGTIVQLIQKDTNCGFSSAAADAGRTIVDDGSGRGSVTWEVSACTMAFPEDTVVSTGCDGNDTLVSGAVTVSGSFRLEGRLTGNPDEPIIPLDSYAALIDLTDVSFDNFTVKGARAEYLTQKSGHFAGTLKPRLAAGESTGACSVATPNVSMENLRYSAESEVRVHAPQGEFNATVNTASMRAVNGRFGEEQNVFEGSITVKGEEVSLPGPGGWDGLLDDFDPSAFDDSYACTDDLKLPVDFESCPDIEPKLISGAARLTVNHFGAVASLLQENAECGFSSPAVIDAVEYTGELGKRGGTATWTITDCELDFPVATQVSSDCNGNETWVQGRLVASGTLTLSGWLASPDDKGEPIVPDSWTPAALDLTVTFEDFGVFSPDRDERLTVRSGTLSGQVTPQTAIDTETGACSIPTSNARLEALTWEGATDLQIDVGKFYVMLGVTGSNLLAVNGRLGALENHLEGTLRVGDETFQVPYGDPADVGENALNPDYDAQAHLDSYSCAAGFQMPASTSECTMYKTIGEGAARLVIQSMGEAASQVNSDTECGFGNTLDILRNSIQEPAGADFGEIGRLEFTTDLLLQDYPEGCEMVNSGAQPKSTSCDGTNKFVDGTMKVRSTRWVGGELECAFNLFGCIATGIIPLDHNEVDVSLDSVLFEEFTMWSVGPNGEEGPGELLIHSGSGTGHVFPILGAQADDTERHMVPTPVAFLKGISLNAPEVTLQSAGKTFKFAIDSTNLNAFNGFWDGDSDWNSEPIYGYAGGSIFESAGPYENYIEGSITVDGTQLTLERQGLDPGFDKSTFNDTYSCTDNLLAPVSMP